MNIAGNHKGLPPTYYYPYSVDSAKAARNPWLDFELKHLELTGDSLYLTDRLTNEAISYIRQQKDSAFFLYLPFYTVHTPIEGRKDLVEKYTQKLEAHNDSVIRNPHFLAMVECMDENIGELLHVLDTLAILENTLIIFVSDNGGLIRQDENGAYLASYNYPLRAGKGTLYEGGLRVPTIIHWPEKFQKGFASNELIISTDIYPTIMDCEALAYIANELGREKEREELLARAELYRKNMQPLWDSAFGLFLNRHIESGELSKRISPTNFYALNGSVASQKQAQQMMEEHYYNPEEFYGEYVMPSVARNDTAYTGADYWRGSIWAPMNLLVYWGMQNYELPEARKDLAEKSKNLLLKNWHEKGWVRENYNAETGGFNFRSEHFYHWGALLGMIYLVEEGYIEK